MSKFVRVCILVSTYLCLCTSAIVFLSVYLLHREISSSLKNTKDDSPTVKHVTDLGHEDLDGILDGNPDLQSEFDHENSTAKLGILEDLKQTYKKYFSKKPEEVVRFYLFQDASNPFDYEEILLTEPNSFKVITVPEGATLKILVHGFISHLNGSFTQTMKNAFLAHTNNPVICVDWSPLAAGNPDSLFVKKITERFLYRGIVDKNIPRVGNYVARFIASLRKHNIISSLDRVHLIGHSLGAHLSGEVGRLLRDEIGHEKLGRITGLDPAGPHFGSKSLEHRLDEYDAQFVDIIHTSYLLGDRRSTGHVDFYPNSDSTLQPGCSNTDKTGFSLISHTIKKFIGSCDHHRAIDYYVQSISNRTFYGCQFLDEESNDGLRKCSKDCERSVIFGEYISTSVRGEYCLDIYLDK